MAQFPKTDAEIISLAQSVLRGFRAHPKLFPNPPINLETFDSKLVGYGNTDHEWHAIQAQAVQLTAKRKSESEDIASDTRSLVRYAEIVVADDAQLGLIGWAGRAAPTPLQSPGQTRLLGLTRQGADWISLSWQAPTEGGKTANYVVQRRELPDGAWNTVETTNDTQITLVAQPHGKNLEYRVYAMNKAGNGVESNVVAVTL